MGFAPKSLLFKAVHLARHALTLMLALWLLLAVWRIWLTWPEIEWVSDSWSNRYVDLIMRGSKDAFEPATVLAIVVLVLEPLGLRWAACKALSLVSKYRRQFMVSAIALLILVSAWLNWHVRTTFVHAHPICWESATWDWGGEWVALTGSMKPQAQSAFLDYWQKKHIGKHPSGASSIRIQEGEVLIPLWLWWFDEFSHASATGAAAEGVLPEIHFANLPQCREVREILFDPEANEGAEFYFSGVPRRLAGQLVWFNDDWGINVPATHP